MFREHQKVPRVRLLFALPTQTNNVWAHRRPELEIAADIPAKNSQVTCDFRFPKYDLTMLEMVPGIQSSASKTLQDINDAYSLLNTQISQNILKGIRVHLVSFPLQVFKLMYNLLDLTSLSCELNGRNSLLANNTKIKH